MLNLQLLWTTGSSPTDPRQTADHTRTLEPQQTQPQWKLLPGTNAPHTLAHSFTSAPKVLQQHKVAHQQWAKVSLALALVGWEGYMLANSSHWTIGRFQIWKVTWVLGCIFSLTYVMINGAGTQFSLDNPLPVPLLRRSLCQCRGRCWPKEGVFT